LFSYGPGLVRWVSHGMSHEVALSWNAPTDSTRPISGYHVYRAAAGSSSYHLLNWTVIPQTKFVDLTAENGHSYDYFVKSVDASTGVESRQSNTIRVRVPWTPNLRRLLKAKDH
jgi:fibronectin type 3 domain-containing protein